MSQTHETEIVKSQYGTTDKLERRISIHEKYSTNKTGFGPWIVSHYAFPEGCRVLELAPPENSGERTLRFPRTVLLPAGAEDAEALSRLFTEEAGHKVSVKVPRRGDRISF